MIFGFSMDLSLLDKYFFLSRKTISLIFKMAEFILFLNGFRVLKDRIKARLGIDVSHFIIQGSQS